MTRTTLDASFAAIVSIVGIPPAVLLAIDEPSGMVLAGCFVGVLFLIVPGRRAGFVCVRTVPKLTRRVE